MANKGVYIDLFNEKTEEFLKELASSFPHIQQFSQFKSGFTFIKNLDKKQPQSIFNTYVYNKYKENILTENEEFFLTNEYDIVSERKEYWVEFIGNIRNIWKNLDTTNKDVIWKYFKVLVLLNEKCLNNT
jgi:hypothetical protein